MDGLGGEEPKRLGDRDRGNAGVFRKAEVLHGVNLCWRFILEVLIRIKISSSYLIGWDGVDDGFPVRSHGSNGYGDV